MSVVHMESTKSTEVKNYAERLSDYPDKGICGLPESYDTSRSFRLKVNQLAKLIRNSKHTVIITGAGISTDAGIPDFRGPKGIWTLEHSGKRKDCNASSVSSKAQKSFLEAKPTTSHYILTELHKQGLFRYLVTQNVDGLHLRADFPREWLAEIHGNLFMEKCCNPNCEKEFFRDFDVGGVGLKPTGRNCSFCNSPLFDTVLDWESPLPEPEKTQSEEQCRGADLIICLGTSLRIFPVGDWPLLGKNFVIVNLQATPIDDRAKLIIRERIDKVMKELKKILDINPK